MKPLVIANLKSNKLTQEVLEWIEDVDSSPEAAVCDAAVAPSFPYLNLGSNLKNLSLCSQDVSPFPPGAYTGEVNAEQLKDLGVSHCIVGHSERRTYFKETNQQVANKVDLLLSRSIIPVVCLRSEDIISQISSIKDEQVEKCIFVFEPPGDIGGVEAAPADKVKETLEDIRKATSKNQIVGYGGSVNSNNVRELMEAEAQCFIVSTASLDPKSFIETLRATHG